MTPIVTGLNQPSSLEIIGNTAYIVTLNGDVWTLQVSSGKHHHH